MYTILSIRQHRTPTKTAVTVFRKRKGGTETAVTVATMCCKNNGKKYTWYIGNWPAPTKVGFLLRSFLSFSLLCTVGSQVGSQIENKLLSVILDPKISSCNNIQSSWGCFDCQCHWDTSIATTVIREENRGWAPLSIFPPWKKKNF